MHLVAVRDVVGDWQLSWCKPGAPQWPEDEAPAAKPSRVSPGDLYAPVPAPLSQSDTKPRNTKLLYDVQRWQDDGVLICPKADNFETPRKLRLFAPADGVERLTKGDNPASLNIAFGPKALVDAAIDIIDNQSNLGVGREVKWRLEADKELGIIELLKQSV
jgi:hypothetical protein